MNKDKKIKLAGWAIYLVGIMMLTSITDNLQEGFIMSAGIITTLIGDAIISHK